MKFPNLAMTLPLQASKVMAQKIKLAIILIISILLCIGCLGSREYTVMNRSDSDEVLFYYVHTKIKADAHEDQYLMAYTKQNKVVPLLTIKDASYLAKIYRDGDNVYLYNDMKYFFHDDEVDTLERMLTTFNCVTGKVTMDKGISNEEGNYYFSSKTKKIEEIHTITNEKIKSVIEGNNKIMVQYQSKKVAVLDEKQKIEYESELEQFSLIYYMIPCENNIIVVGMGQDQSLLIQKIDWSFETLQQVTLEDFDDVKLSVGDDAVYGVALKVNGKNQLFLLDKNWEKTIIDEDFKGYDLLFLKEQKEVIYYDATSNSYVFLDSNGNQKETYPVLIKEKDYNFPQGKLYID